MLVFVAMISIVAVAPELRLLAQPAIGLIIACLTGEVPSHVKSPALKTAVTLVWTAFAGQITCNLQSESLVSCTRNSITILNVLPQVSTAVITAVELEAVVNAAQFPPTGVGVGTGVGTGVGVGVGVGTGVGAGAPVVTGFFPVVTGGGGVGVGVGAGPGAGEFTPKGAPDCWTDNENTGLLQGSFTHL